MSLPQILKYTLNFFDKIDTEVLKAMDQTWLPLGHYIVMIVDVTHLLKRCYEDQSYRAFSNYK